MRLSALLAFTNTAHPASPAWLAFFRSFISENCLRPTGLWSSDSKFIYFVQGVLPDKLDIWRIRLGSNKPELLTWHSRRVSYPILLDRHTLMYLAGNADGSGPSLYGVDTERRIPHRLTTGLERSSSLAASADGRRLVVTVTNPSRTLWRLPIAEARPKLQTLRESR